MEKITKIINYWIFKPVSSESKYFYIRCKVETLDNVNWFVGYKNSFGLVSSVGGDLSDSEVQILEKEYQKEISKILS